MGCSQRLVLTVSNIEKKKNELDDKIELVKIDLTTQVSK